MTESFTQSLTDKELDQLLQFLLESVQKSLPAHGNNGLSRREAIHQALEVAYAETKLKLPEGTRLKIFNEISDELSSYGPLQVLLDDPSVTEIMVNGPSQVFAERNGKLEMTDVRFQDDAHIVQTIQNIVQPLGRRIDAQTPAVDARLPDGSRVNAVVPPVAIDSPLITIRKFPEERLTTKNLIEFGSMTPTMGEFMEACVRARLNVMISGGTGSGKTTLLNILSGYIPDNERIVTIEDAAELRLQQTHVVRMETRPPDPDGRNEMPVRILVRNSLRMRPDRIVVGEVRGGEALDMLQAMNTGHDGSLTTLHANSPRDAISRLETMVLMAGMELPVKSIRQQIASAVDVILQVSRFTDGTRKITHISEVSGMEGEMVTMSDIFRFTQTGTSGEGQVLGEHKATGIRPLFMQRLEHAGLKLSAKVFMGGSA